MNLFWHNIKMTSNASPAPYAVTTSSDYSSAYSGWTAFDGVNTDTGKCWSANANTGWITFDFGMNNKSKVGCVEISARLTTVDGAPKDFTIEISDDNLSWTIVKTVVNETGWTSAESRKYIFTENFSTRYVRINTTSNNGRVRLDIGEVRIAYILPINKSLLLHDGEYKKWNKEIPAIDDSVNAIPIMTSYITPKGVASSSGFRSGFPPYHAFDNNSSTLWRLDLDPVNYNCWLMYEFEKPKIIERIEFSSFNLSGGNHGVKNFEILGSNDGMSFTNLYTGVHPNNANLVRYSFLNNEKFKMYKLKVISSYTGYTAVATLNMYEQKEDKIFGHWTVESTSLSNSIQFIEQGMDNLSPLLDRKVLDLEPMTMTDKSNIFGFGETGKVFTKTIDLKKYLDIRKIRIEVK
ncbi:discoidin domain-containing protein [Lysinibacillus fusiformis]|uniref:discoidin domain-containing protein n=1 Tax=Lysinibacillus fusiformis TaxID=28031 RepID=UPI0011A16970|nr:discoidin domain-containing protein [Lysinibacillus fusiformis]